MTPPDIICIGSVLWDVIGRSTSHMRAGSDVAGRITRLPGGVALNIAMALKGYGLSPALLSSVGRDAEGEELVAACVRMGLITDMLYRSDDLPTDRYMAVEGGNGLIAAIADAYSLEAAGAKILRPLSDGRLPAPWTGPIVVDGNLTSALLAELADTYPAADLRVAPASPGKAERLQPYLSHGSATLYVNLEEAGLLMHRSFDTSAAAAQALCAQGLRRAVVTDGPNPAAVAREGAVQTATPPEVLVTRVTGAGDTFMAAHIAAEVQNHPDPLARALEAAAAYISGAPY